MRRHGADNDSHLGEVMNGATTNQSILFHFSGYKKVERLLCSPSFP